MNPTDVREPAPPHLLVVVFAVMALLVGIDLVTDLRSDTAFTHVVLELLVVAIGFAAAGGIALRLRGAARAAHELRAHAEQLSEDLRSTQLEAARWRSDAANLISGLSAAIDTQLARWELTGAESDIALLLLKGLSHKEIAQVRSVSETTVRQQARSLYRKAGLSGRNELAAFFLEDLLGPREPTPRPGSA